MERARRDSYDCPHCREPLEAANGPWQGWLLCPHCGLPGMPPQVAPAPGRDRRRPKPRPAPAQGVFVTNAPKEKLPSPEAFASTVALAATGLTLASLIYLQQLKAETIAMMLLLISLFGLLAFVHNARK